MCLNRCQHCGTVEVPKLDIDRILTRNGGERPPHVALEQRIVANLLVHLSDVGFIPLCIDDGEDETAAMMPSQLMNLMFNLDDCKVYFYKDHRDNPHVIKFIFGNSFDVVSDWSYYVNDTDGFNAAMNAFDPRAFA